MSTFFYIYLLSNIGEKIAYQMKIDLFSSIIRQDIAFFDERRTGEIINRYTIHEVGCIFAFHSNIIFRLTADIQDFKSSFKQTVSAGLRAGTQIIGCAVSLLVISPQMTLVTLFCVPTVIAVGTMFGALLRAVSRAAQAQVKMLLVFSVKVAKTLFILHVRYFTRII